MAIKVAILLLLCIATTVLCGPSHRGSVKPHLRVSNVPRPGENGNQKRAGLQALSPQQVLSAYNVAYSSTAGSGKTVCLIDAYGCPTCESNLGTWTNQWGYPACTTANGCFRQVGQSASSAVPAQDTTGNWGFESAMDVQAAHAFAPGAKKILISCNSASYNDLFAGIAYANTLGCTTISMSWGGGEAASLFPAFDSYFQSGRGYFASTGDNGKAGGIEYPSSSSKVIAVGGTSLYTNSGTFSSEQAWSGSGGGCSAFTTASSSQQARIGSLGCGGKKALPDASLLADPASGMYTYYTGLYNGATAGGWYGGGGTSLAAPLLAARAAVRGIMTTPDSVYTAGYSYRDITVGNNGYAAGPGMDLATGIGSLLG